MSNYLTPCLYTGKAIENQWVNGIYSSHDLFCGCNSPIKHLAAILQTKQLCLPSPTTAEGTTQTGQEDAVDTLEPGDLDKLFEESFDEDDG